MTPIIRAAVLPAVSLTACSLFTSSASVNRILAEPQRYADDGIGTLWVISYKGVSRKDAHVCVRGTVRDALDLGGVLELPEGCGTGSCSSNESTGPPTCPRRPDTLRQCSSGARP